MQQIKNGKLFLPVIGAYFKDQRERISINQETAAYMLGIARSNIAKYEKGEIDMPASKIPELCQIYSCKAAECGQMLDAEMSYVDMAEQAVRSKFADRQYMAFVTDTPMMQVTESVVDEDEFKSLIESCVQFMSYAIYENSLPMERCQHLRENMAFFLIEFIKLNESDRARRERLVNYCNEMMKQHNQL